MRRHGVFVAGLILVLSACVSSNARNNDEALQAAASYTVSVGQHGEGVDPAEATAEMDRIVASAPEDPYVLRYAALMRLTLIDSTDDKAARKRLATEALTQIDRAVALAGDNAPVRHTIMNGQQIEVDLSDATDLRTMAQAAIAANS